MRSTALAFTLAAVVALTGCVPQNAPPAPQPDPTFEPVFASDEEALAAAEAAYGEYVAIFNAIAMDAGQSPERIRPVVTEDQLARELSGFAKYSDSNWRTAGQARFDSMSLQKVSEDGDIATVATYLCFDVTHARLLDESGTDVTPSNRTDRVALEVTFEVPRQDPSEILIADSQAWEGEDFC